MNAPATTQASPFVRWAGGKGRLLVDLVQRLPEHHDQLRYVAPFVGGGALFFHLQPERALLGDACHPLVVTYRALQTVGIQSMLDRLGELADMVQVHGLRAVYATVRDNLNGKHSTGALLAADFVFLNRACFNGLWRVNADGHFNVAPDPSKTGADFVRADLLWACSVALCSADVLHQGFRATLTQAGAGDFVFADPPYVPAVDPNATPGLFGGATRVPSFTAYTAEGWKAQDTVDVFAGLAAARDRGAHVMATNHDAPEVRALAERHGFKVHAVEVHRSISCDSETRGATGELIITGAP